jgi:hypothetical protein
MNMPMMPYYMRDCCCPIILKNMMDMQKSTYSNEFQSMMPMCMMMSDMVPAGMYPGCMMGSGGMPGMHSGCMLGPGAGVMPSMYSECTPMLENMPYVKTREVNLEDIKK